MMATEAGEALRNAHYQSAHSRSILRAFTLRPTQTRQEMKDTIRALLRGNAKDALEVDFKSTVLSEDKHG